MRRNTTSPEMPQPAPTSPMQVRSGNDRFLSEYQYRMQGNSMPEYQQKKSTGKRSMVPMYQRHKDERLSGVGMIVVSENPQRGMFNQ